MTISDIKEEKLSEYYYKDPNVIAHLFLDAGYTNDYIENMFNTSKPEIIVLRAKKILKALHETSEVVKTIDSSVYEIPKKFKKLHIKGNKIFNLNSDVYKRMKKGMKNDVKNDYNRLNKTIPKEIGETLEQLYTYKPDEYYIGIHRTGADSDSIMKKGIKYGYAQDLSDHVQKIENFITLLSECSNAEGYKNSDKVIITKIPKKDMDAKYADEKSEPIFYIDEDNNKFLRPEYIAGYVSVKNKKLQFFEFNKYNHDEIYNRNIQFELDSEVEKKMAGNINIIFASIVLFILMIITIFIIKK